jgi:transcriptional regulator with XRE-family HTH domain
MTPHVIVTGTRPSYGDVMTSFATNSHVGARAPGRTADLPVGVLLRQWREHRRMSQLALASTSAVSTRHLSYVETGRSKPSRELVEHLAERLDVPLRERNRMLLAAGYAPGFTEARYDADEMAAVRSAIEQVIAAHDPYPAIVVDGRWDLLSANSAATMFLAGVDPSLLSPSLNVVRVSLHPDGMAPRILNFDEYAGHLVDRLRRQVDATADPALTSLLAEVEHVAPGTHGTSHGTSGGTSGGPTAADVVMPLVFDSPAGELRMFSTIATFGAPLDVTVSELAIESFYPSDAETGDRLASLAQSTE